MTLCLAMQSRIQERTVGLWCSQTATESRDMMELRNLRYNFMFWWELCRWDENSTNDEFMGSSFNFLNVYPFLPFLPLFSNLLPSLSFGLAISMLSLLVCLFVSVSPHFYHSVYTCFLWEREKKEKKKKKMSKMSGSDANMISIGTFCCP